MMTRNGRYDTGHAVGHVLMRGAGTLTAVLGAWAMLVLTLPGQGPKGDTAPSAEQAMRLDAFLDQLGADRRPAPRRLTVQETTERIVAAQMRLVREGVEEPTPAFLHTLEHVAMHAVARTTRE